MSDFERSLDQLKQFAVITDAIVLPFWFKGDWATAVKINPFAAKISQKFFAADGASTQRSKELPPESSPSLAALQRILADSRSRSRELENVLLQQ